MNKNIRKNSNLLVTADMKYNFSVDFKSIFTAGVNNFHVYIFVDRKRMARSGGLEFPWISPPTGKFHWPSGITKTNRQIVISLSFYPCRLFPVCAHIEKLLFDFPIVFFCNSLWVCSPSGKFQFLVVAIYVKKIHEQIKEVLFLRKDKRNGWEEGQVLYWVGKQASFCNLKFRIPSPPLIFGFWTFCQATKLPPLFAWLLPLRRHCFLALSMFSITPAGSLMVHIV